MLNLLSYLVVTCFQFKIIFVFKMTYFRKYKTICERKLVSVKLNMFVKLLK